MGGVGSGAVGKWRAGGWRSDWAEKLRREVSAWGDLTDGVRPLLFWPPRRSGSGCATMRPGLIGF